MLLHLSPELAASVGQVQKRGRLAVVEVCMEAGARRHWTDDDVLADEIELYGEMVVAASESERRLTLPQIDRVLGVDAPRCDSPGCEAREDDAPGARTQ